MPSKRLSSADGEAGGGAEGVTLSFRDIRFTVKDRHTGNALGILKGVSGKASAP